VLAGTERGHLHDEGHARRDAASEELDRRARVQRVERLPVLFAQDAHRVHDRIDPGEPPGPPQRFGHGVEVHRDVAMSGDAHDLMPFACEGPRHRATDEARRAGDQDPHGGQSSGGPREPGAAVTH
jgi:hypothetical protein